MAQTVRFRDLRYMAPFAAQCACVWCASDGKVKWLRCVREEPFSRLENAISVLAASFFYFLFVCAPRMHEVKRNSLVSRFFLSTDKFSALECINLNGTNSGEVVVRHSNAVRSWKWTIQLSFVRSSCEETTLRLPLQISRPLERSVLPSTNDSHSCRKPRRNDR